MQAQMSYLTIHLKSLDLLKTMFLPQMLKSV